MSTTQGGTWATTGMVGRDQDLHHVRNLLRSGERLITLRGPGGIGKTTLARELASAVRGEYDHVLLVDLSALRDPRQVLPTISATLPVTSPLPDPQRNLVEFVDGARVLLTLDNFEQLLPAAEHLPRLLEQAPSLQLLVTSRAGLHLHDEVEVPLEPLALPGSLCDAAGSPAVQLFVRRARASVPKFELSDANTELIVRLCEALEGVPLAIELAASRLRLYALPDLLARLERPLNVLRADFRDRPERLRSLRAAVQWSYDLLPGEDRAVFEACAVFAGSFTPDALVAVWGDEGVLDEAGHLIEQSFLQRVDGPVTRWKMLQPLRELALEKLDRNEQASVWRERHARHFMRLTEEVGRRHPVDPREMRARFFPDYPNVMAGLAWAVEHGEAELALKIMDGMPMFWVPFGLHREGYELARKVLDLPASGLGHLRRRALHVTAECVSTLDRPDEFKAIAHELVEVSREHGNEAQRLMAQLVLAVMYKQTGDPARALQVNDEVLRREEAQVLDGTADAAMLRLYSQGLMNSSIFLLELGEHDLALERALDARPLLLKAKFLHTATAPNVAFILELLNRTDEAVVEYLNSLRTAVQHGYRENQSAAFRGLSRIVASAQGHEMAVRLSALAERIVPLQLFSPANRLHQECLVHLRESTPSEAYEAAWVAGERWSVEEALTACEAFFASSDDQHAAEPARASSVEGLTARELEVLTLVVQGHPDRKIAKLLSISPVTASKHVSNMLGKLNLRNRTELAAWAVEHRAVQ